jgi:hypothetical protein
VISNWGVLVVVNALVQKWGIYEIDNTTILKYMKNA